MNESLANPNLVRLQWRDDGRLLVLRDGQAPVSVYPRPCFPWTEPRKFISLRDKDDNEVALIADLDALPPDERRAVEWALADTAFVIEVTGLDDIEAEFEIRNWKARTRQGPFTFQTKLDEWPRRTPSGGLLLVDVAGNLILFRNPRAMDARSQKLLWAFID